MSFSPNLKVLKDWRGSLNVAFSILRRVRFIVEETFSFGDFDPQINWNGMTITSPLVTRARYLKIFKMFWFSLDIGGTLAAPFTNIVTVTMPFATAENQGGTGFGQNAATAEGSFWEVLAASNSLVVYRAAFGNYTAGAFRTRINGFLEIE